MNNLMNFIKNNDNWLSLLQQPPYNLIVKSDPDYPDIYLFKYNQYGSDMSNIICQEARGIILEIKDNVTLLCHSFDKFFNYCEDQGKLLLESFNWDDYTFQEKRDGSLLRLWYWDGKWRISTSGTIDAYKASIDIPSCPDKSFGSMFERIFKTYNEDLESLNKTYTYSFEMTSPNNKIVVDYLNDELTLIGIRDIVNNIELDPVLNSPFTNIKLPKIYNYNSIDDALKNVQGISNFEGFVLCDNEFRRVKIKTEEYLALAHIADETGSDRVILRLILENKIDDVQTKLPHIKYRIDRVRNFILDEIRNVLEVYRQIDFTQDRKTIALQIKGNPYSSFIFKRLNNPHYDFVADYFKVENLEKIYKSYKEKMKIEDNGAQ